MYCLGYLFRNMVRMPSEVGKLRGTKTARKQIQEGIATFLLLPPPKGWLKPSVLCHLPACLWLPVSEGRVVET